MSLRHAILTALVERPSSGRDLTRRFDRSIGYFWSATHQQIYRELGRLEDDGLIASLPLAGGRGNPRAYEVTSSGRDELTAWTTGSDDPRPRREALFVRMRASAAGAGSVLPELRRLLDLHRGRLEDYRAIERRDFADPVDERQRIQHAVMKAGIREEEFWVAWLTETIDDLDV